MPNSYLTYADVDAKLSNLADLIPDTQTALDWVDGWIAEAESEIDTRIQHRYAVPFTGDTRLLKSICLDLTTYFLLRENYHQEDGQVNDWVADYRKRADSLLRDIADGTISLQAAAAESTAVSSTTGVAREFTRTKRDSSGNIIGESGSMEVW